MPISDEEAERRRGHVRVALADSRIEGHTYISPAEQEILDAYVRGDIEARDLVDAIKSALHLIAAQGRLFHQSNPRRGLP